jgi:excinuclease ABC subunit B
LAYNEKHGITPKSIKKSHTSALGHQEAGKTVAKAYTEPTTIDVAADPVVKYMSRTALEKAIETTRKNMQQAAKKLEFIEAAQFRDELIKLEELLKTK